MSNDFHPLSKAYTLAEEIANGLTHGLGAALSIAGMTALLIYASLENDVWKIVSFSVYGSSLVLLFLCSTLYHSFQHPGAKQVFKLLDHCAIYLLIAGTYTPFLLVNMRGPTGWILFAVIWSLAIAGITFKLVFKHRYPVLSVMTYLLMGWLILFASQELAEKVAAGGIWLMAAGGIVYTLGVVFYMAKRIPFNHAIWHLFVLGGSTCHFFAIFHYV